MHLGHDHVGHAHVSHSHAGHGHDVLLKINRSFAIAVVLNVLLVVGEAFAGFWAGSMALLADAGHNLSDVAGLIIAWGAHWLRGRGRTKRWTYGWRAFTILAANVNGLLLVIAIVGVSVESVRRLWSPVEIDEFPVIATAAFATALNFATAWLLAGGSRKDLNIRGAYLHMLADAAVSLAVVIGALVIYGSGWQWIDPVISIGICIVLALGTWGLLRESTTMLMHAAPRAVDVDEVRKSVESWIGVKRVLDLHVWSVSTTDVLLTARLWCPELTASEQDEFLEEVHQRLEADFDISHATLEVVRSGGVQRCCSLETTADSTVDCKEDS